MSTIQVENELKTALKFGARLIATNDLDPVYNVLYGAEMSRDQKDRTSLAYWCFYNLGLAAEIGMETTAKAYYDAIEDSIPKGRRGAERRHWRGEAARRTLSWLREHGEPESIVEQIFSKPGYADVANQVKAIPVFGPWITWKIADMGERCLGRTVDFSEASLSMYRDPVQGAAQVLRGDWRAKITSEEVEEVTQAVIDSLRTLKAPPSYDRQINIQEAETVLCKYKSWRKGNYWIGKDIKEIGEAMRAAGPTARRLAQHLPREVRRCR